jgi:hypothetical protein
MTSTEDGVLVNWIDIEFFFFLDITYQGFNPERMRYQLKTTNTPTERDGYFPLGLTSNKNREETEQDKMLYPERQRRRRLLNCFDGWDVIFFVGTTGTPVPSAPTISPAPSPSDGVIIQ